MVTPRTREAIGTALRSRKPRDLEPGVYTVVLESYATQDLMAMLAYTGMGAQALQEGQSWLDGRIGKRLMAPSISIWDDGLDPTGLPVRFHFEGMPKQRVDLVKEGTAAGVVYDRTMAREEENQTSAGHALPSAIKLAHFNFSGTTHF